MGSYPVSETKLQKFAFIGPAYWIWEPLALRPIISRNARPNILAQLSAEKQLVGEGGGFVLHSPLITNIYKV
jgi:hypothetical protein